MKEHSYKLHFARVLCVCVCAFVTRFLVYPEAWNIQSFLFCHQLSLQVLGVGLDAFRVPRPAPPVPLLK